MKDAKVCKKQGCQIYRASLSYVLVFTSGKGNRELGSHFTHVEERSACQFCFGKVGTTVATPYSKYICIVGSAPATGKFVRIKPYSLLCKDTITCFLKGCLSVFLYEKNKSEVEARNGLRFSIRKFNHSPLFMGTCLGFL